MCLELNSMKEKKEEHTYNEHGHGLSRCNAKHKFLFIPIVFFSFLLSFPPASTPFHKAHIFRHIPYQLYQIDTMAAQEQQYQQFRSSTGESLPSLEVQEDEYGASVIFWDEIEHNFKDVGSLRNGDSSVPFVRDKKTSL